MSIAILITLCSKNQDWENLCDCDFLTMCLDSFIQTLSHKHKYKFFIGYDENDDFFASRKEEINKRFGFCDISVFPKECNGNPCEAWNILARKAYDLDYKYFYQCGSDIVHLARNWDDYFINVIKKYNNDAIIGGVDQPFWMERVIRDLPAILENVFFSRTHIQRFGWIFPSEVKTWYSDDILTKIYRNVDKCLVCPNIKYKNMNRVGGNNDKSRYVPPENTEIAKTWSILANKYSENFLEKSLDKKLQN